MCQSSILEHKGRFFQLGPADTNARKQLTLWSSQDVLEWKVARELYLFYERNDYTEIVFDRVILK